MRPLPDTPGGFGGDTRCRGKREQERKEGVMDAQVQGTGASRIPLVGLLLVQLFVGYEWFMSGLTKIVRGGFAGGLAKELGDKSSGAAHWYKSFLDGAIIPHATVF